MTLGQTPPSSDSSDVLIYPLLSHLYTHLRIAPEEEAIPAVDAPQDLDITMANLAHLSGVNADQPIKFGVDATTDSLYVDERRGQWLRRWWTSDSYISTAATIERTYRSALHHIKLANNARDSDERLDIRVRRLVDQIPASIEGTKALAAIYETTWGKSDGENTLSSLADEMAHHLTYFASTELDIPLTNSAAMAVLDGMIRSTSETNLHLQEGSRNNMRHISSLPNLADMMAGCSLGSSSNSSSVDSAASEGGDTAGPLVEFGPFMSAPAGPPTPASTPSSTGAPDGDAFLALMGPVPGQHQPRSVLVHPDPAPGTTWAPGAIDWIAHFASDSGSGRSAGARDSEEIEPPEHTGRGLQPLRLAPEGIERWRNLWANAGNPALAGSPGLASRLSGGPVARAINVAAQARRAADGDGEAAAIAPGVKQAIRRMSRTLSDTPPVYDDQS